MTWTWRDAWKDEHGRIHAVRLSSEDGSTVAETSRGAGADIVMSEEHAFVLQAAPDLLAFVRRYTEEAEASGGWPGDVDLFQAGMALIAKAEGR